VFGPCIYIHLVVISRLRFRWNLACRFTDHSTIILTFIFFAEILYICYSDSIPKPWFIAASLLLSSSVPIYPYPCPDTIQNFSISNIRLPLHFPLTLSLMVCGKIKPHC
jgi:hypothetical protein